MLLNPDSFELKFYFNKITSFVEPLIVVYPKELIN